MQTIESPPHESAAHIQQSLTEAVRPSARELAVARRKLHFKAAVIGVLVVGSYWALVIAETSVVVKLLSTVVLITALTAAATSVFHDANHSSFSTSRTVNRLAGYTGDLLGASSWIWRFKHNNLHHGSPNMVGVDADIDQAPFARLAPDQPWRAWHRYQHLYMWFLYGFLTLQWFLISDFADLLGGGVGRQRFPRRPRRRDVALLVFGKAAHLGWAVIIPLMFHRWWVVLTFYLSISWIVGLLLATMFQLAHCAEPAEFFGPDTPRRGPDFVTYQLRTTADVHCRTWVGRHVLHWLMGGLDFQVEHHLAPRLPHTIYPLVAGRLDLACAQQQVTVLSHPSPWKAIRSHGHWLKLMGQRPGADAQTCPARDGSGRARSGR